MNYQIRTLHQSTQQMLATEIILPELNRASHSETNIDRMIDTPQFDCTGDRDEDITSRKKEPLEGSMSSQTDGLTNFESLNSVPADFYSFNCLDASGQVFEFQNLRGKVILVVNVASQCAFTSQYAGLEELHREFANEGFAVLGFPCNQFGNQEPGSNHQILEFCKATYDVNFPIMQKCDVNGPQAHPVFEFLKRQAPGLMGTESIKWNFTKFLISRSGEILARFAPTTEPMDLVPVIRKALGILPDRKAI